MPRVIIESENFERIEVEIDPEALRIVRARKGMPLEASIDHLLGAALISRMLPARRDGRKMIHQGGGHPPIPDENAAEAGRCAALAITKFEEGTMFAVKSRFPGD